MTKLKELKQQGKEQKTNVKVIALSVVGIVVVIAVVAILAQGVTGLNTLPEPPVENPDNGEPIIGKITTFIATDNAIELQDGKPVIRLFSTTWCPHCKWISATYEKVAKEYAEAGKVVAYHWEVDIKDDTLTQEFENSVPASEIAAFQKFNAAGSVPTFVFGGKYYRIGTGHELQNNLAAEESEFRGVIEALLAELEE